ncbi:MAG: glutaredoxin [Candidatus Marinimicrobia bacterium]|nr:glutaredoxin [Candidatus Neomarinimicrobiota bacterium]
MMLEKIQSKNQFKTAISRSNEKILVLFYTESSDKSLQSLQALKNLDAKKEDAVIYTVDAKSVSDIHPEYDISSVPTVVVFRNGEATEIITGVQTEGFYKRLLQKFEVSGSNGNGQSQRVTVYTTQTCPYCDSVKRYLSSKNVSYSEIDISADEAAAQELVQRTGQQGVPQTEIDGKFVIGYDTNELDRLLNL